VAARRVRGGGAGGPGFLGGGGGWGPRARGAVSPPGPRARPGAAAFPAAAGRAAGATVVVVAAGGDAGVAAADGAGGALQLGGAQTPGQGAQGDEQESCSGHPGGRRHGDLSMETDGVVVSVDRPRARRMLSG